MQKIHVHIKRFLKDDAGPTAVEYAILLAMILLVCITGIAAFGTATNESLTHSAKSISR